MSSGSRSSVQNAIREGPNSLDERRKRGQVARHRRFTDQEPDAGAQPLSALLRCQRLVVGADPRRGVGVQLLPGDAGRVAVDVLGALQPELRELALVAGDHAREVHHLGEPEHAAAAQEALEVAVVQRAPRRLEARRGHARRRHEVDVERQVGAEVEQPVHAVGAEHVRDLVRVRDDRGRAERQHEPGELVRQQLRRLEMQVRVDQPGHDESPAHVEGLAALVVAEAGDIAVDDGDARVEPLAREDREHAAAPKHEVGGLVAAGDGESAGEIGHWATILSEWTSTARGRSPRRSACGPSSPARCRSRAART